MPTSEPGAEVHALGLPAHAAYACRDSGVCCSSNWEIPVEAALHERLVRAIADGDLRAARGEAGLVPREGLPAGLRSVLGRQDGRCVFHGDGTHACRLHAWGGAAGKPVACRQFPWVTVHDPRGTFVSLSHVCPTAAALLQTSAPLTIGPLPHAARAFEGLDVRHALPPALDAGRLADWDAVSAWEQQALAACARAPRPEAVVADLAALLAHARGWRPSSGTLAAWIASWTPDVTEMEARWQPNPALDAIVRAAVPAPLESPPTVSVSRRPAWEGTTAPLTRYLAARLVACWPLHFGRGLATVVVYVDALLSVIATELARAGCLEAPGDRDIAAAIAETDRLAVHLAAPDALAAALDEAAARAGL